MTLLDPLLVVVLVLTAVAGHRVGLLVRAAGVGGLVVGVALATVTVPLAVSLTGPRTIGVELGVGALTVALTVLVAMIVLQVTAFRVRRRLDDDSTLRALDRGGGAALGVVVLLLFVWVTAPLALLLPAPVASQVRGSAVVDAVTTVAPDAPNPLRALQTFVASTRFPEAYDRLAATRTGAGRPAAVPLDPTVVERVAASTVEVEGEGCDAGFSGSGWTVEDGLVVTNAHVVDGARVVSVRRHDGAVLPATVVALDRDRDLALLDVPTLAVPPLPRARAVPDSEVATFGHPLGRDEVRVAPARVDRTIEATSSSADGERRVRRRVVVLAAGLSLGDSGSAVVDRDGAVVGTVFAIDPDQRETAYALADAELATVLDAPRVAVPTAACG